MHYTSYRLIFIILKAFELWSTSNILPNSLLKPHNFTLHYNIFFLIEFNFFSYINLNPSFESWYIIFYFNGRIYTVVYTNTIIINVYK